MEEIPYDISFEILKRSPAKSLMRFKCVCCTWRTIIEDRIFAEQHHVESKSRRDASYILLFVEDKNFKDSIIPVNNSAVSTTDIAGLKLAEYTPCTDVVEGLVVCIFEEDDYTLSALNVTTGEKLRLPPGVKLMPLGGIIIDNLDPVYFLGFDPLNKNYKLLNFRLLDKESGGCQILTIGENSWREIDRLNDGAIGAKFRHEKRGVSVNGAIYWSRGPSVIRYFDVHSEKFMQLDLPHGAGRILHLGRVGDSLGLLCMGTQWPLLWTLSPTKVWKMQGMHHLRNSSWIPKHEIFVSTKTGEFLRMPNPYGYIKTCHDRTSNVHEISFHSYDSTSKSKGQMLIKIKNPWVSSSILRLYSATCDHVENILPLKTLSSGDRKD